MWGVTWTEIKQYWRESGWGGRLLLILSFWLAIFITLPLSIIYFAIAMFFHKWGVALLVFLVLGFLLSEGTPQIEIYNQTQGWTLLIAGLCFVVRRWFSGDRK